MEFQHREQMNAQSNIPRVFFNPFYINVVAVDNKRNVTDSNQPSPLQVQRILYLSIYLFIYISSHCFSFENFILTNSNSYAVLFLHTYLLGLFLSTCIAMHCYQF